MVSILIPTYHYNALPLVTILEKQALASGVNFEIICIDDGSFSHFNTENQKINTLTHAVFIENHKNLGRIGNRNLLAQKAQYDWLLFIDVDLQPLHDDFLARFLKELHDDNDVVFGGICYHEKKPNQEHLLRWTYGTAREQISVPQRKKKPYQSLILGCFAINKNLFFSINDTIKAKGYGLDILFSFKLKQTKARIQHIDNPMIHLGLDTNEAYIEKSKKALQNLHHLFTSKAIPPSYAKILKYFYWITLLQLTPLGHYIWRKNEKRWHKNLVSTTPNLLVFDVYRLGYLCKLHRTA